MVPHKLRWILYTTFLIWTGTETRFRVPRLDPFVTNGTSRFVLPLLASSAFLLPDFLQYLNDLSIE
jgi:hypothetical protein